MASSSRKSDQAVIETYFVELSCFNYDKAKQCVDKEKETTKVGAIGGGISFIWQSLASALSTLIVIERSYTSLAFLNTKRFLRPDNSLKSQYESLKSDLTKLTDVGKYGSNPGSSNTSLSSTPTSVKEFPVCAVNDISLADYNDSQLNHEKLLIHLCGQLISFVSARLNMIELYEKMYLSSSNRYMIFEDLHLEIKEIISRNQKKFHHPLLVPIKSIFNLETKILSLLIDSQICIAKWKFFPSLMSLFEAHCKLGNWFAMFNQKESKKLIFSKTTVIPPLYQWLVKLKGFLLSKFSLYFHGVLSEQTTCQEMKNMCMKNTIDHYQKIVMFQKHSDAQCINIIFEAKFNNGYGVYPGYKHPSRIVENPEGINSYPIIFSYPKTKSNPEKSNPNIEIQKSRSHRPNLLMIMANRSEELSNTDRVIYFYDKRVKATYFVTRVEPGITLVVIFDNQKSDKDNVVTIFLQELTAQLRGNKIFSNLKPGSKAK